MKAETIKVTEKKPDKIGAGRRRPTKGMTPLYERMTFGVTATGPQEAAYRAIREFQATNLLHEVRGLTVGVAEAKGKEKADPKTLDLEHAGGGAGRQPGRRSAPA